MPNPKATAMPGNPPARRGERKPRSASRLQRTDPRMAPARMFRFLHAQISLR
jgi:hypothetical protein